MSDDSNNPTQRPKITLDAEVALGRYSNFVSIAHNYSEVVLDFGRTLPGRADIPVVARLIMSPFQAKQLLRALSHNLSIYEKNFGPINEPAQPQPPGGAVVPPNGTN